MQPNHTYSLKAILDSDRLDPDLCRLMLHEIKSPLLEHSFQMTADQDRSEDHFGSLINENIEKNRGDHNHLDSYSMTNSVYETSRKMNINKKKKIISEEQPSEINKLHEKFTHSIVSPLDHQNFLGGNDEKEEEDFHFFLQSDNNQLQKQKGPGKWCGNVFNPSLEEYSNQVLIDPENYQYLRRKIFKKKGKNSSKTEKIRSIRPKLLSFTECIQRLTKIDEPELANFIFFLSKCLPLLSKLRPYFQNLGTNSSLLYQLLIQNSPVNYETKQCYQNKNRIKNRVKAYYISQVLQKLTKNKRHKKQLIDQKKFIEDDIQIIFRNLNQVEDAIENYVSRKQTVNQLKIIHDLLYPKDKRQRRVPGSPIQNLKAVNTQRICQTQNSYPQNSQSLKIRILRLLNSLKIDEYYFQRLEELQYIWSEFEEPNSYHNSNQFIRQLCKNDLLIMGGSSSLDKNHRDTAVVRKLEQEGFTRNI